MPDDSVWICCRSCGKGKMFCRLSFGVEAYIHPSPPSTRHQVLVTFVDKHLHCGENDKDVEKQGELRTGISAVAYLFKRNIGLYVEGDLEWIGEDPEGEGAACRLKKKLKSSGA